MKTFKVISLVMAAIWIGGPMIGFGLAVSEPPIYWWSIPMLFTGIFVMSGGIIWAVKIGTEL